MLEPDDPFARWERELAELDAAYAAPKPAPLVPGTAPDRSMTPEWIAEMARRAAMLRPLAEEMAQVYATRLGDAERRRAQVLLAAHPRVVWQWPSAIRASFDRFLDAGDRAALDLALALTAIY